MIDDRKELFPIDRKDLIVSLCDRKMGIGADGLILIRNHQSLDFRMIFFNPDGSQSLCGNGSRCAIAFAKVLGMIGDQTTFETTDGVHDGYFDGEIPHFHLHDVKKTETKGADYFINTGSPHYIRIVEEASSVPVIEEGRKIRYSAEYAPGGTNVNFLQKNKDSITVRTYERGVEDETLSCGTGVTASALAASLMGYASPVKVVTKGGNLKVAFSRSGGEFTGIYLSGPVKKVYEGTIEVSF